MKTAIRAVSLMLLMSGGLLGAPADAAGAALPDTERTLASDAGLWPHTLLAGYCLVIVLFSLVGGWLPSLVPLTHARMQGLISFVGGLMLGIGILHLLPHAIHESGSVDDSVHWMMFGILTMFLLMRAFHVHHHGPLALPDESGTVVADSYRHKLQPAAKSQGATAHHHHDDHSHPLHAGPHAHTHTLSWLGIALGLGVHTLIDGIVLGASVKADARGASGAAWALFGVGTFLAVALHKPLDALSITSLMAAAGWPRRWRHAVNAAFAVICPLGAVLFLVGIDLIEGYQQEIVASALAFAAGVFVCIALGDLLPEMEFHSHSRVPLTAALLTGIALAWAITFLEPAHLH